MMHRRAALLPFSPLVAVLALALAGCGGSVGGGPEIKDVRSCLEDAKMKVEGPQEADDDQVEEGVAATAGVGDGALDPDTPITIVVAANVKEDEHVKSFEKKSKAFQDQLTAEQRSEFTVRSGHDGRYVWVVAGDKDSKVFRDAEECVQA